VVVSERNHGFLEVVDEGKIAFVTAVVEYGEKEVKPYLVYWEGE
jgi:hypothetical protein